MASAKGREGEQSDAGNNAQNKPSTISQQAARTQNREATLPVPSTTAQSKNAVQTGEQLPATDQQRGQEPNQGQRAETTPPASKQNEKAVQPGQQPPATGEQRSERPKTTPLVLRPPLNGIGLFSSQTGNRLPRTRINVSNPET
jgi:hypothetical protein